MRDREPWFDATVDGAVEYLVERLELADAYDGMTGRSSDALVRSAFSGVGPYTTEYPRDRWDWRRCLLAYALAPTWLRERMRPIMRAYRASLPERYQRCWSHPVKAPRLDSARRVIESFHDECDRAANSHSEPDA